MHMEDRLMDDEPEEVLAALRNLITRVANPVVRACLEDASDDIIHLTGRDVIPTEDANQIDAA